MYIVIPTRRSTANSVQLFVASAFGDAGITYFLGLISKALKKNFEQNATVCPGSEKEQWNFFHPYRYFFNNYGLNTDFKDTAVDSLHHYCYSSNRSGFLLRYRRLYC